MYSLLHSAPRRINGTRVYTRRDRARLALILRAKAIGSSLAEIKQYLDMYGSHGEGRAQQLKFVLARTDQAIAELEQKRAHIDTTLAEAFLSLYSGYRSEGRLREADSVLDEAARRFPEHPLVRDALQNLR